MIINAMEISLRQFWSVALSVTCLKLLLIPSYRSTDFEVHRNWLSVTHNLPLSKWYYESTSQWTMDYPPLFAWFEYALSQLSPFFDPKMLQISSKPYESPNTVIFQRLTVIATDVFYYYSALQWCGIISKFKRFRNQSVDQWFHPNIILAMLFLWNPSLLIVDHIHFQYNGILSGLMLLSIARMLQRREIESAFWFSVLLNFKHIYLYIAPAYFIHLLGNYCYDRHRNFKMTNFIKLSTTVGSVFLVSFGPFLAMGQLSQVMSRLFPFKRGLSHAYWAPNFWALYNTADKVFSVLFDFKNGTASSMTDGRIHEYHHQTLFSITPSITMLCVVSSIMPSLYLLWKRRHQNISGILFVRSVIICAFCSFTFGWHVHEKAILLVILPLTPLAMIGENDAKLFVISSTIGTFALFPLLYKEAETPTKLLLLLIYCVYTFKSLEIVHCKPKFASNSILRLPLLNRFESLYILGLIIVQLLYSFSNLLPFVKRYPFLPLMVISDYCSIGLIYCFLKFYYKLMKFL